MMTAAARRTRGGRGYYRSIRRVFLFNTLLAPLVPLLLVGGLMIHQYDFVFGRMAMESAPSGLASGLATKLAGARLVSLAALLLAVLAVTVKAWSLSHRMAERVAATDREKQRLNEQMCQTAKMASIGELAAGVAHEINNPIAVMIEEAGWVRDLLEEEDPKAIANYDEIIRTVDQIAVQGRRCKEITAKLLLFARCEDADVSEIRVDLLLEDLLPVVRRRAGRRNTAVEASIASGLPPVNISHTELQQVLFNLINNALDAMEPEGGDLLIKAGLEDDAIQVAVEDTGVGIPAEDLGRVFDPFYTTKPVGQGTGLGLSICWGLVSRWGGSIQAERRPGGGTRVRFTIPLHAQRNQQPRAAACRMAGPEVKARETA